MIPQAVQRRIVAGKSLPTTALARTNRWTSAVKESRLDKPSAGALHRRRMSRVKESLMLDGTQFEEVRRLRQSLRKTQALAAGTLAVLAFTLLLGSTRGPQVLRAKGLVIVDEQGQDRILLGAPTPSSADRKRKDAQTESLVFVGADGADRVIIGQTPDPYIKGRTSQRIAQNWGLIFSDPSGNERGGMGFLGTGRASMALDRPNGDAVGMMVDDHMNFAGMGVNGVNAETALMLAVKDGHGFVQMEDPQGRTRAKLEITGDERPSWELHDAATAPKSPE